jgi:glycosyltransferase involved in cell wall biosynthesis
LKILIVHQFFLDEDDPGGSRMNEFANYLSNKGETVTVLAGSYNYLSNENYPYITKTYNYKKIYKNVNLIRVKIGAGHNKTFFKRLFNFFEFTIKGSWKVLFMKKHDVVITTSPPLFVGTIGRVAKIFKRSKWIFEVRDLWPEFAETSGVITNKYLLDISYKYEKRMYKKSDKISVLTPSFKNDIIKRYGISESKIKIFTNGADFEKVYFSQEGRKEIRERYNFKDKIVFMYTGAHGLANGLYQIIEIAKNFKNNTKILFVLIGDGMMKHALVQKKEEYNLDNVLFIDPVGKNLIYKYLSACDVAISILLPNKSFEKIYPNKVFDYMSCKRPIINLIPGQTAELINQARCGLNVTPGDIEDFKNKILQISESDLNFLGQNGFNYVKEYFNRKTIMEDYYNFIKSLSNKEFF